MGKLFGVTTPLGCEIETTTEYWDYVSSKKHPYMSGKEMLVQEILENPDEIRKSRIEETVFLYYLKKERLYCAVAKHESGKRGFLLTAYPADKVKEGEILWKK